MVINNFIIEMKTIWFIRHGESEANAGLPTDDPRTISLTAKGREQAEALTAVIDKQPDLFIISPYIRTRQTAKPLLKKFPTVPTEIWPLYEFDFLSPALCINTTVGERRPWVQAFWERCDADYMHGTDAESFTAFKNRVIGSIKKLESISFDFIIVFAHGHVMRAIWQYLITGNTIINDASMKYFRDTMALLPVPNTAIFKAQHDGSGWVIKEPQLEQIKYNEN